MKGKRCIFVICLVLLILLSLCGLGIAQPMYKEAPMLAELVKQGQLPPVEERLPSEPLVIEPVEVIGKYGGSWNRVALSPTDTRIRDRMGYETLVRWGRDGVSIVPNLAKSWELKDD